MPPISARPLVAPSEPVRIRIVVRLAGAVRAEEADDLALLDREVERVDRDGRAVDLRELFDADHAATIAGEPSSHRRPNRQPTRSLALARDGMQVADPPLQSKSDSDAPTVAHPARGDRCPSVAFDS